MSEKFKYMSTEWGQEAKRRLQAEVSPEKMKHLSVSVCYRYVNCPGGQDRYLFLRSVAGDLEEVACDEGQGPQADFVITGDYELFAQITRGDIKAQRALMGGKLKLKGNMVKALKLAAIADRINKVLAGIPTEY